MAILCVKWAQMAALGEGLEKSKISFLGSKPTQDPMNNVFEQKELLAEKNLDPREPTPTEKNFGPSPARGPKVVQIVPLGSLTLLKRSGTLKNGVFDTKYYVKFLCLAKVMPKTRFLASVGVF